MATRNIIVIGASAGGIEAVAQLVKKLPQDLPAAVLVVMHFPANGISVLPDILQRLGSLPAEHAQDGDRIRPGHIYVAQPNRHLLVHDDRLHLGHGPKENGYRPSIDALFQSTATAYGERAIGVILSGMLDDGVMGLKAIKNHGGIAIVQDPEEALFSGMPLSCIESVQVDAVLTLAQMATELQRLVTAPMANSGNGAVKARTVKDNAMAELEHQGNEPRTEAHQVAENKAALEKGKHQETTPSPLTCPECGGVLWELKQGELIRYRCHIGHTYSINSMLAEHTNKVEQALWTAVRILEEKASLSRRMASNAEASQRPLSAARFQEDAAQTAYQAELVRQMINQQSQNETPIRQGSVKAGALPVDNLSVDAIAGDRLSEPILED